MGSLLSCFLFASLSAFGPTTRGVEHTSQELYPSSKCPMALLNRAIIRVEFPVMTTFEFEIKFCFLRFEYKNLTKRPK